MIRGAALMALALASAACSHGPNAPAGPTGPPPTARGTIMQPTTRTADDLERALALAESQFPSGHAVADYRLVRAERLLAGHARCPTPRCWLLTFKPSALVPTSLPARLTAGGELFVLVDVDAGRAELTGFGE